ncbi:ABC transporter permease [bacterium]|nr:ABC transporter permease [bacterium]
MAFTTTTLREGLNIAFRALIANKTRSLLTTLGIVIGVLTVTVMLMIIQGLNTSFTSQLSILGSNTIYIERWPWIITDGSWWKYINRPEVTAANYEYLRDHSQDAYAVAAGAGTRRTVGYRDERLERVRINGATPEYLDASGFDLDVGRFFSHTDERAARQVCVIGSDLRDDLFRSVNPMGRDIRIGNNRFRVVGILTEQGESFGETMDKRVVIPLSTFEKVYGHRRGVQIVAKAAEGVSVDDLEDEMHYLMRRARELKPLEEDNFVINRQEMLESFYKRMTSGIYAAGLIIGGIALLVGGVGIMNIMLVSVTERTWEIGMRKAVGAKTTDILWQFLVEAMLICSAGGLLGLGLAAAAGAAIKSQLPVSLPLWLALAAVGFSATVGLLFGIFPAAKASRLDPIVALRSE